ncbi:pf07556 family protein [Pelomyxa schiedti]|nr:pf07556 family protein [Pelomyxa schiedti]
MADPRDSLEMMPLGAFPAAAEKEKTEGWDAYRAVVKESIESKQESVIELKVCCIRAKGWPKVIALYYGSQVMDKIRSVVPIAAYLVLFQIAVLRISIMGLGLICAGLCAVMVGLLFFIEGLKTGLMQLGDTLGKELGMKSRLWVVLIIACLLGIAVTFAEPALVALQLIGVLVQVDKTPYLYALLNSLSIYLVLAVSVGVGLAAVLGVLRNLYNWKLKWLIFITLIPTLALSGIIELWCPKVREILGLAWDCGAVTTGPVTVPLVLSLGIGVASSVTKKKGIEGKGNPLSGFGIVTLASIIPIFCVLCLSLLTMAFLDIDKVIDKAHADASASNDTKWWNASPVNEIILAVRATVPLILFLLIVIKLVLRARLPQVRMRDIVLPPTENVALEEEQTRDKAVAKFNLLWIGLILTVIGMTIFNIGMSYGLAALGSQTGRVIPILFSEVEGYPTSPLFGTGLGLFIAILFAFVLGIGATLAEPALLVLGEQAQTLSQGRFSKWLLLIMVSLGVASGIACGLIKIYFQLQLVPFLLGGYFIACTLSIFAPEEYVNVGWDSAGVTTGPVTVPLILALGVSFGNVVDATEGFGILALASVGPIIAVLTAGMLVLYRPWRVFSWCRMKMLRPYAGSSKADIEATPVVSGMVAAGTSDSLAPTTPPVTTSTSPVTPINE